MIYITGDTHGYPGIGRLEKFASENPGLTKADYVLIAGDFGAVWDEKTLEDDLKPYEELPFTVLFIDGNHENFDLLEAYPTEIWHGGKVHFIKDDIIHLTRGQVFDIDGKLIFTLGGATSVDKNIRLARGYGWWPRETPTYADLAEGLSNLALHNNKVDYIVTHTCCERALYYPLLARSVNGVRPYFENALLSELYDMDYKRWYFGHHHLDGEVNYKMTAIFEDIIPLE